MKRAVINSIVITDLLAISVFTEYLSLFSSDSVQASDFRDASAFLIGILVAVYALVFPSVLSMLQDLHNSRERIPDYISIVNSVETYSNNLYQNMIVAVGISVMLFLFTFLKCGLYETYLRYLFDFYSYSLLSEILCFFSIYLQGILLIDILVSTKRILDIKTTLNLLH